MSYMEGIKIIEMIGIYRMIDYDPETQEREQGSNWTKDHPSV